MVTPIVNTTVFNADPDTVWNALTDFQNYSAWNDFCPRVQAEFRVGGKIVMKVRLRRNWPMVRQTERFRFIEPKHRLVYGISYGFLLYTERIQELKRTENGATAYSSVITMRGWLAPLVHVLFAKPIQAGFERSIAGLKDHLNV